MDEQREHADCHDGCGPIVDWFIASHVHEGAMGRTCTHWNDEDDPRSVLGPDPGWTREEWDEWRESIRSSQDARTSYPQLASPDELAVAEYIADPFSEPVAEEFDA